MRLLWWSMALWRFVLGIAPYSVFRATLELRGSVRAETAWARELCAARHATWPGAGGDQRFDAREWLSAVDAPAAVVVTVRDRAVPPAFQRDLARRLDATVVESSTDHLDTNRPEFTRAPLAPSSACRSRSPPPSRSSAGRGRA